MADEIPWMSPQTCWRRISISKVSLGPRAFFFAKREVYGILWISDASQVTSSHAATMLANGSSQMHVTLTEEQLSVVAKTSREHAC